MHKYIAAATYYFRGAHTCCFLMVASRAALIRSPIEQMMIPEASAIWRAILPQQTSTPSPLLIISWHAADFDAEFRCRYRAAAYLLPIAYLSLPSEYIQAGSFSPPHADEVPPIYEQQNCSRERLLKRNNAWYPPPTGSLSAESARLSYNQR